MAGLGVRTDLSDLTEGSAVKIMKAAAAAIVIVGGGVGCSFARVDQAETRTPPGVAQVTVDGEDAGRFELVQCVPARNTTAITIGAEPAVVHATVSSADSLGLDWIRFRDANGFTGSYNDGLNGTAKVDLRDTTYQISGTASGFKKDNPSVSTTATFSMEVTC